MHGAGVNTEKTDIEVTDSEFTDDTGTPISTDILDISMPVNVDVPVSVTTSDQ